MMNYSKLFNRNIVSSPVSANNLFIAPFGDNKSITVFVPIPIPATTYANNTRVAYTTDIDLVNKEIEGGGTITVLAGQTRIYRNIAGGTVVFNPNASNWQLANIGGYGASDTPTPSTAGTFKDSAGIENGWQAIRPYNSDNTLRSDFLPRLDNINNNTQTRRYFFTSRVSFSFNHTSNSIPVFLIGDGNIRKQNSPIISDITGGAHSSGSSTSIINIDNFIYKNTRLFTDGQADASNSKQIRINNCLFTNTLEQTGINYFVSSSGDSGIYNTIINSNFQLGTQTAINRFNTGYDNCIVIINNKLEQGINGSNVLFIKRHNYFKVSGSFILRYNLSTAAGILNNNNYFGTQPTLINTSVLTTGSLTSTPNINLEPLFNNETHNDFTLNQNSPHFRNGLNFANIANARLGFPVYATSNGNEIALWNGLSTGTLTDVNGNTVTVRMSNVINLPYSIAVRQIHFIGREDLTPNMTSVGTVSRTVPLNDVLLPASDYDAPTDINHDTGRVIVYCKFTFARKGESAWLPCETHSDIFVEIDNDIVIRSQFNRTDRDIVGTTSEGLKGLWQHDDVIAVQYAMYYPQNEFPFRGITLAAHQYRLTTLRITDVKDKTFVTDVNNRFTTGNINTNEFFLSSESEVPNITIGVSSTPTTITTTGINRPYGFSNYYTVNVALKDITTMKGGIARQNPNPTLQHEIDLTI